MSEGVNRVFLMGNLGSDPELKVTAGGLAILKLRLATSKSYKDKEGVKQNNTEWHSCTMFDKRAEALAPHLKKGDRIFVEGELRTTSYEKDGEKRYRTEIIVGDVKFAGGGSATKTPSDNAAPSDEEIPF